ncbi:prepilin-type N-terminal cleavage/methylation domain-containing protein [Rheinheimera maricola]|uniref:Prepilin-type N-terminal cleavage/methylation domain-containing protein n=1 Tax=Rheinheimera maricola TaxID=2793282 RepID=A0ABS7XGH3_9GAMM|nr:prepilin-type N-terminal cleavage/methylation domain-containing protein [Rheinheimera maricola]MBZ9613827.1 prepilin-type N-terminal cleavage/methylation domain-containing protein [Rheinheimera maricola]
MKSQRRASGFTLVELIVVLVLIGVLAVSLVPRFFDGSGTSEYLYRDQALNLLRRVQMQAMQCTLGCSIADVNVSSSAIVIGSANCSDADTTNSLCIAARDAVALSPVGTIRFDNFGRASCSAGACTLNVLGASTLSVCIESEGYIHPC